MGSPEIKIRAVSPDDEAGLRRLAELDSTIVPEDDLLVGEHDGALAAAIGIRTGAVIANPFTPTAELVGMLRLRRDNLLQRQGGVPSRLRIRRHAVGGA